MKRFWMLAPALALAMALTSMEARANPADAAPDAALAVRAPMVPTLMLLQDQPPPPKPEIDVKVTSERTVWYTDPAWIAIGIAGAAVIIALIAAGARRDSTTVVR